MNYWDVVANRTRQHTAAEYEAVAYRLVSEQVLYYIDRHSRTAYWMVSQYERDFSAALEPIGINIEVNRRLRYVYAIPRHAKAGAVSIGQTVLALVLRAIYDEAIRAGQVTDDGEVVCDLIELEEKYRLLSGRELPTKAKLDQLFATMKRWGLARRDDETPSFEDSADDEAALQPYSVVIRPGIVDVLGETAISRLALFKAAARDMVPDAEDDNDDEAEETAK